MKATKQAIGVLKGRHTVNCEICGQELRRNGKEAVYENTQEDRKRAENLLLEKLLAPYTCKICKSMLK